MELRELKTLKSRQKIMIEKYNGCLLLTEFQCYPGAAPLMVGGGWTAWSQQPQWAGASKERKGGDRDRRWFLIFAQWRLLVVREEEEEEEGDDDDDSDVAYVDWGQVN